VANVGTISGNVTDGTNPIVGATLSVVVGGTTYLATSVTGGSYSIANVPVGTGYTVNASATGYNPNSSSSVAVTFGTATPVNFALTAVPTTGTIAGTVTNNQSAPLSGATVSVVVSGTTYTTTTAVNGTYTIASVPAGTGYTVTATATNASYGVGSAAGVAVTSSNTTTTNFTLTYSEANWSSAGFSASDGVSNLLKYAFAMTPAPSTRSQLPTIGTTTVSGQQYLTITYTTQPLAGDVTYSVQASTDMVNWTAITSPAAATTSPVTVTDTTPLTNGIRRFLRVQVVGP